MGCILSRSHPPGQHPLSDRYKREIEDLLRQLDTRPLREPLSQRVARRTARFRSGFQSAFRGFLRRPPVEQFMILSLALVLASLIFQLFPPMQTVARWTQI